MHFGWQVRKIVGVASPQWFAVRQIAHYLKMRRVQRITLAIVDITGQARDDAVTRSARYAKWTRFCVCTSVARIAIPRELETERVTVFIEEACANRRGLISDRLATISGCTHSPSASPRSTSISCSQLKWRIGRNKRELPCRDGQDEQSRHNNCAYSQTIYQPSTDENGDHGSKSLR